MAVWWSVWTSASQINYIYKPKCTQLLSWEQLMRLQRYVTFPYVDAFNSSAVSLQKLSEIVVLFIRAEIKKRKCWKQWDACLHRFCVHMLLSAAFLWGMNPDRFVRVDTYSTLVRCSATSHTSAFRQNNTTHFELLLHLVFFLFPLLLLFLLPLLLLLHLLLLLLQPLLLFLFQFFPIWPLCGCFLLTPVEDRIKDVIQFEGGYWLKQRRGLWETEASRTHWGRQPRWE